MPKERTLKIKHTIHASVMTERAKAPEAFLKYQQRLSPENIFIQKNHPVLYDSGWFL